MKPKSAKAERKKLPGARIATAVNLDCDQWGLLRDGERRLTMRSKHDTVPDYHPVLVLPMPTLKSAKARLKIEQMTEEELVEGVAKELYADYRNRAHPDTRMLIPLWSQLMHNVKEAYRVSARRILSFLGRSGT